MACGPAEQHLEYVLPSMSDVQLFSKPSRYYTTPEPLALFDEKGNKVVLQPPSGASELLRQPETVTALYSPSMCAFA